MDEVVAYQPPLEPGTTLDRPREQFDPYCPLHWRSAVANKIKAGQPRREDYECDPLVIQAADYLNDAVDEETREAIDQARAIHDRGGLLAWEIEARIIAGQSDDEIAQIRTTRRKLSVGTKLCFSPPR